MSAIIASFVVNSKLLKNSFRAFIDMSVTSFMFFPLIFIHNTSFFKRAPLQVWQ